MRSKNPVSYRIAFLFALFLTVAATTINYVVADKAGIADLESTNGPFFVSGVFLVMYGVFLIPLALLSAFLVNKTLRQPAK
jgi:hypothetical protein